MPIHAEVGWFALALGFEVIVAAGATHEWRGPLLLFVPLFFVAALASRASTVWTSGGAGELDERVRAAWIRRALIATGALVGAMAVAVVLSVEGGVFDRIGVWLTPAANAVATFLAWLLSQAARPIFFLVDLLGIDPDRVREFLDRLREGAAGRAVNQGQRGPARDLAADARVPGVRGDRVRGVPGDPALPAARRRRAGATRGRGPRPKGRSRPRRSPRLGRGSVASCPPTRCAAGTPRRSSPSGGSRSSASRGRRRPSSRRSWPRRVPACASEFARLTHAYEDVRYGSLRLDRAALQELQDGQKRIAATLREG